MSREIDWRRQALDDFRTIRGRDHATADRIASAIEAYAEDDRGDVRKLSGNSGMYRLRVGDWRVLFTLEEGGRTVGILRVLNRRDAYRD